MQVGIRANYSQFVGAKVVWVVMWLVTSSLGFFSPRNAAEQQAEASNDLATEESRIACTPTKGGFLFVDHQCLVPPYEFESAGGRYRVNGVELQLVQTDLQERRRRNRDSSRQREPRNPIREFARDLENGRSIVFLSGQPAIRLEQTTEAYYLLRALVDVCQGHKPSAADLDWLRFSQSPEDWRQWLAKFEPGDDFLARAQAEIEAIDTSESTGVAAAARVRRRGAAAYAVFLVGMTVTVLAIGHLISHPPAAEPSAAGVSLTPLAWQSFSRSLLLAAVLAAFDLVWTLLWSQTEGLVELNPLGSRLIRDPHLLVAFKGTATFVTLVVLFLLRAHRIARVAAWWSCLVFTLVAMRWLTVNSLFT